MPLLAANCAVVRNHPPSEADQALLAADYAKAVSLYQAHLAAYPHDTEQKIGLVHALLRQQKVQEAADAAKAALADAPNSASLITLRGEVEYRQGMPWIAAQTAFESDKLDPCNPRNHLLLADLERISSLYASSRKQLERAHQLDPVDPEIRGEWLHTLPLKQRIAELEAYLSVPTGNDEEDTRRWREYLERLKKMEVEPHEACRLVSTTANTDIPFDWMYDANHLKGFGLDVKLNGRKSELQIDTGAGGILVSRSVAKRAGLKPFVETKISGVGDEGDQPGYSAYAESIHIGNLEFQDCQVHVLGSRNAVDNVDGLIGMDVFSHFLVTLDYPDHKLLLNSLPPRPGESAAQGTSLKTSGAEGVEDEEPAAVSEAAAQDKPVVKEATTVAAAPVAASGNSSSKQRTAKGPYDRYIAPEMKDYIKVYRIGHDLILPAGLNSKEIKLFIMDTGAFATTISPQAAREVTKVHSNDHSVVRGIDGRVEKVYSADDISFHFANLIQKARNVVSFDTSRISKNVGMEISGLLGESTLNLLTIHIDYRDGLVKFDYDPKRR